MKHTLTIEQDSLHFEGELDLKIYADYEISGNQRSPEIDLLNYQISVIVFGIETDLTREINWELNKPQNHKKKARFIQAILDQIPFETAADWLHEERNPDLNNE